MQDTTTQVTMSSLMKFLAADTVGKATVISQLVAEQKIPYHPSRDYWKQFRDGLAALHEAEAAPDELPLMIPAHTATKARNYEQMAQSYVKWRRTIKFTEAAVPPRRTWLYEDFAFVLNPEIIASINGAPHVIKLYLRSDTRLDKRLLADPMLAVMDHYYAELGVAAILDVGRSRLFTATEVRNPDRLRTAMHGQASAFGTMWRDAQRDAA